MNFELDALRNLALLFDGIPDVQFWIKDKDGRFTLCSRSFAAHFGLSSPKEMEGKTDFEVSPHHLALEYVGDDKAVLSGGRIFREKLELVKERDGSLSWYTTTKVPLRDPQGSLIGTAGVTRRLRSVEEKKSPSRDLERAIMEINANHGKDISIGGLAALAGMSVDSFERRFRRAFRETPLKYLNRIRMRAACGLLIHTDLAIGEVARQCGFADPSYFSKRFHAHFRVRPLDYRKKHSHVKV